ncbi:MAG: hypothetical protein ACYTFG_01725 [Planctomycetota bacterium]
MADESVGAETDEEDILEPAEEDDIPEPCEDDAEAALEPAPAVAVATAEEDEAPSPPQQVIDEDTIVFLDYCCEEDFIAVMEGDGSRDLAPQPEKKSLLPLVVVFLILLLGGGGFALWWFVLRGA